MSEQSKEKLYKDPIIELEGSVKEMESRIRVLEEEVAVLKNQKENENR